MRRRAARIVTRHLLSARADLDLLQIYLYGVEEFGHRQAERYKHEMDTCFEALADFPRMGRLASNTGPGIRRHEHGSHVIFYREEEDHILILAVVHGRSVSDLDL